MTGVLSLTLGDDGRPAIPGIPVADLVSGLHGLSGVLMALLRRQTTGKGDYIELGPEELEAVAIESKRTIDIDEFVEFVNAFLAGRLDPLLQRRWRQAVGAHPAGASQRLGGLVKSGACLRVCFWPKSCVNRDNCARRRYGAQPNTLSATDQFGEKR